MFRAKRDKYKEKKNIPIIYIISWTVLILSIFKMTSSETRISRLPSSSICLQNILKPYMNKGRNRVGFKINVRSNERLYYQPVLISNICNTLFKPKDKKQMLFCAIEKYILKLEKSVLENRKNERKIDHLQLLTNYIKTYSIKTDENDTNEDDSVDTSDIELIDIVDTDNEGK
jgi:hypothetical protein